MPRLVGDCEKCFAVVRRTDGRFVKKHVDDLVEGDDVVGRDFTLRESWYEADRLNFERKYPQKPPADL
jgi:hypothetical protein